jgi:hypothetical protein
MFFSPTSSPKSENKPIILFFAVLFFFCSADQLFTFHLGGFNLRWGQILLFAGALLSLLSYQDEIKASSPQWIALKKNLLVWVPFGIFYGISAAFSPSASLGFFKLAWAIFNISGSILICLNPSWSSELRKGFLCGFLGIVLFVWAQVLALYVFGSAEMKIYGYPSTPLILHFLGQLVPLGFVQPGNYFQDVLMLRPNVFYYEPSYAGCALSFLFPLLFILENKAGRFSGWVPAAGLTALLLVGSRAGGLGCLLTLVVLLAASFFLRLGDLRKRTLKILGIAFLALLILGAFQGGRRYLGFLWGPLGPRATYLKIQGTPDEWKQFGEGNEGKSERGRIGNMKWCLSLWEKHFWWGQGVEPNPQTGGIKIISANTWLEIGLESGLFGILAFLYALYQAVRMSLNSRPGLETKVLLLAALSVHLLVNLNFSQTFPRLDYWLLFYFSMSLLAKPATGEN